MRWAEFCHRHADELDTRPQALDVLREGLRNGPVTLPTAAKNPCCNHELALIKVLDKAS